MQDFSAIPIKCPVEISGDLGLAIDVHRCASQGSEINPQQGLVAGQCASGVHMTFGHEAVADPGGRELGHRARLQDAGPDPAEDMRPAAALKDDTVDARLQQFPAKEKTRWTATDDGDFCPKRAGHRDDRPMTRVGLSSGGGNALRVSPSAI